MLPEGARANTHAVQFYGDSASLVRSVATFLSEGLGQGEPAVIIASTTHRDAILAELASRGVDVEKARRTGDLVLLDADDTLGLMMTAVGPDAELFERYVGKVIEQTVRGRRQTSVRAYGEMVDILWRNGQNEMAIELEVLWNRLATRHSFSLLCGYSMGHFYKQPEGYRHICEQHSHVIEPATSRVLPFSARRKPLS